MGFIKKITITRVYCDNSNIIEFLPRVSGDFDLKFMHRNSEIVVFEKKNINVSGFSF